MEMEYSLSSKQQIFSDS